MYDIFVFHKWREQDGRDRVLRFLDQTFRYDWRNFSNVWYDPIIRLNTADGKEKLSKRMDKQIAPVGMALLCAEKDLSAIEEHTWFQVAANLCQTHQVPVLGVLAEGASEPPEALRAFASQWVALEDVPTTLKTLYKK